MSYFTNLPQALKRFTITYCALQFVYYFSFFWLIQNVYMLEHGITFTQLSVILAVWSATIILLEIPSGVLADRMGRRFVIVIGKIGFLLAMILYAAFPSFWGFIAVVILIGVHESFISGAQEALLFDTFQFHNQTDKFKKALAIATTSREIGLGIGVLIAGFITSLGVQYNLIGSIVIAAISVVLSLRLTEQSRATPSEEIQMFSTLRLGLNKIRARFELRRIVLFSAIVMVSYVVISEYFIISLRELKTPYPLVGAMAALEAIFFALGSYLAHKINSKRMTLIYSILSMAMAIGMFVISGGALWIVIVGWMFLRVVKAIGEIVSTDDWQQYVGTDERATSISINSFIKNIVYIPLAILFGKLSDSIGLFRSFSILALFAAVFLFLQLITKRKYLLFILLVLVPPVFYISTFNQFLTYRTETFRDTGALYTPYFFPSPNPYQSNKLTWLTNILNTPFNLDWYDVCIENNSFITLNGTKMRREVLNDTDGIMRLAIYPLQENMEGNQIYDFVKERGSASEDKFYEYGYELLANPGTEACLHLPTSEKGLYFTNPSLRLFNSSLAFETNDKDKGVFELVVGDEHYRAISNNSKLVIKTNYWAFVFKGIIFWLLFDGVILLVIQILKEISKKTTPINTPNPQQ